jgi:hypothetical protein
MRNVALIVLCLDAVMEYWIQWNYVMTETASPGMDVIGTAF